jgi:hypothetical protein
MVEYQRQKEEITKNDTFLTLQDKEIMLKDNSHREWQNDY